MQKLLLFQKNGGLFKELHRVFDLEKQLNTQIETDFRETVENI